VAVPARIVVACRGSRSYLSICPGKRLILK
jgi:hypothetical protein